MSTVKGTGPPIAGSDFAGSDHALSDWKSLQTSGAQRIRQGVRDRADRARADSDQRTTDAAKEAPAKSAVGATLARVAGEKRADPNVPRAPRSEPPATDKSSDVESARAEANLVNAKLNASALRQLETKGPTRETPDVRPPSPPTGSAVRDVYQSRQPANNTPTRPAVTSAPQTPAATAGKAPSPQADAKGKTKETALRSERETPTKNGARGKEAPAQSGTARSAKARSNEEVDDPALKTTRVTVEAGPETVTSAAGGAAAAPLAARGAASAKTASRAERPGIAKVARAAGGKAARAGLNKLVAGKAREGESEEVASTLDIAANAAGIDREQGSTGEVIYNEGEKDGPFLAVREAYRAFRKAIEQPIFKELVTKGLAMIPKGQVLIEAIAQRIEATDPELAAAILREAYVPASPYPEKDGKKAIFA
ncbi:MAG: hypothetical protein HYV03_04390 [Deltaproteobacteria bacterium]|nr:hypothetical protein [Deltaproteobacteria bacterium]